MKLACEQAVQEAQRKNREVLRRAENSARSIEQQRQNDPNLNTSEERSERR
jgi:hypothetical protein